MHKSRVITRTSQLLGQIEQQLANQELDEATVHNKLLLILQPPNRLWTVDNVGNIHFTLSSEGFTPPDWENHLRLNGRRVSGCAREILYRAPSPLANGVVRNLVVRPGHLISDSDRSTRRLSKYAVEHNWQTASWDDACLSRIRFKDEQLREMGLKSIIAKHPPIADAEGNSCLLGANTHDSGGWLDAYVVDPNTEWSRHSGFMYVKRQPLVG